MLVWPALLLAPLVGFALLMARSDLDGTWEHHPAHFWLVLAVAAVNVALAYATGEAARARGDARLFLVSLTFLVSAGFLGLHALATPGVLLAGQNAGFVLATPAGLLAGALFAAASALRLEGSRGEAVMRRSRLLVTAVFLALGTWAAVSLAGWAPLDEPLPPERAEPPLGVLAVLGVVLYGAAAVRYWTLYRERRAPVVLAVAAAFVLLAEAMIAIAAARSWHLSWWEWHLLMATAFGLVAASTRRARAAAPAEGTFAALYLDETLERVDRQYAEAVRALVAAPSKTATPNFEGIEPREAELLERAAREVKRLDELLAPYLSPQLAARLREDPRLGSLGGEQREVSVLFADLAGFTAFSERRSPVEVISMLNEYWRRTVPLVLHEFGGMIERFAGDAVMVVFNAADDQPDHAERAARAALALQRAAEEVAAERPEWPRFRVGVNTGAAVVGNVGTHEQRSFTAIGDTTNLAARLQTVAGEGEVVVGEATRDTLGDRARVEPLGTLELKGKATPVQAFRLVEVARAGAVGSPDD